MRDAAENATTLTERLAEDSSTTLKRRINAAIRNQADAWGIRFDQAQALLLDRKVIA